jgi:hypothetical protein
MCLPSAPKVKMPDPVAPTPPPKRMLTPEDSLAMADKQNGMDATRFGKKALRIDLNSNTGGSGLHIPQ